MLKTEQKEAKQEVLEQLLAELKKDRDKVNIAMLEFSSEYRKGVKEGIERSMITLNIIRALLEKEGEE